LGGAFGAFFMADLAERFLDYGARIVKLASALPASLVARRIGDQLLRSGIAVGANYEEPHAPESRSDFIHKLQVGLKELRESNYWLRLLVRSEVFPAERLNPLIDESNQLRAILSKAVATAKGKGKQEIAAP
jgi:four helix bundle protein